MEGWNREIEVFGPIMTEICLATALPRMSSCCHTICESSTGDWICLSQRGGAIEACGACGKLGDGVHDEC